jgi:Gpi18-like mannosyltransferase
MQAAKIPTKTEVVLVLLLTSFIVFLLPYIPGHESDRWCWENWAWHNYTNGLRNSYGSGTNYLPLYQYVLWGYGKIIGNGDHIGLYINNLRAFTLLFDLLGLWLVYKWTDKRWPYYLLVFLNVLNLGYVYNTVIWGQVDGILATLVFASIYVAFQKRFLWSALAIVLAINLKLQAIVFVPVWGLVYLFQWAESKSWKTLITSILWMIVLQAIILLPFMLVDNGLEQVWKVVVNSVDTFPRVSMNAFNFWYLATGIDTWNTSDDTILFLNLTYKSVGLLLFFTGSFFVLWPLLKKVGEKFQGKAIVLTKEEVWIRAALIGILFFFLNTQMHERYSHPAFIFIAAYAFYSNRFLVYVIFSVAYFLNMERVLMFLHLNNYKTVVFNPDLVAFSYLLVIIFLGRELRRLRLNSPAHL